MKECQLSRSFYYRKLFKTFVKVYIFMKALIVKKFSYTLWRVKILKHWIKHYNLGHMSVDICEIWQKVLVRELAKSAYFRSASSESENKWFSVEGLGTRLPLDTLTCLKPMTISPKVLSLKSIGKSIDLWIIYKKSLLPFCLWYEITLKL